MKRYLKAVREWYIEAVIRHEVRRAERGIVSQHR